MPRNGFAEKFLDDLVSAVNTHEPDAVAGCFAEDYRSETPLHPARAFVGREEARENWQQVFVGVPDLRVEVLRRVLDGSTVWIEWEFVGTLRDGTPQLNRGVTVFGTEDGRAVWSRFYLEPVEEGGESVGRHLRKTLSGD